MIGPDPVEILDALGIAWGVHELYPNPTSQQAFLSAIQRLDPLRDVSLTYEIGAGSVACNGEELHIERGGTERLSRRLFVHEVQWLELTGVPSPVGLSQFFSLLAADEQETRAGGGIAQQLQSADVWSIAVTQRGLLTELVENAWEEREDKDTAPDSETGTEHVIRMLATGAPPGDVAGALVNTSDGNPDLMAESFIAAYRLVYSPPDAEEANESVPEVLDAAYRSSPRGQVLIETFVDAFYLLPVEAQAQILEDILDQRDEAMHSLLLDQFAGAELAELAPHLEAEAYERLVEYARDVLESDVGTADELLPLVSAARDVKTARLTAADRIREMIEGIGGLGGATGGLAGQLRSEMSDAGQLGAYVLLNLFEIEERTDRFERLVEGWTRHVSAAVQAGQMDDAIDLASVGTDEAELAPTKRAVVESGLVELLRSDFSAFNAAAQDPERREALAALLAMFGAPAALHLMERLSLEEDPATRRTLIGLLVVVGSSFSEPIARFFKAPEWYVVRNAVSIAGKIGGRKWVPHLRPLLDHEDHRVVVEAMRALSALSPDESVPGLVSGLAHGNERVRETASLLLQASASSKRESALTKALADPAMDTARRDVAALLFELGTPAALDALQQVAKTFAISPTRRNARRAAREVLGSAA